MALRSWRTLTIALLLASACPPPGVSNALIADAHRHDRGEAGKTLQSRGRNRIGSTVQPATCRTTAESIGGRTRSVRLPMTFARKFDLPTAIPLSSASPTPRAPSRLRC